jgi:hypothetical protein
MLFGNAIKKFEATFNVIVDFSLSLSLSGWQNPKQLEELKKHRPNSYHAYK